MGGAGLPLTPFPAVLRSLRALDPTAWGLPLSAANARATWVDAVDAREAGDQLEAVVLFDGIVREADDEQARQVREVWLR